MLQPHHKLSFYSGLLIALLLGSLFVPGVLLLRDMAVLDHPVMGPLGFGDLPARNAPQDGFLALVGMVFSASWFVRLLLVASAAVGAWGAAQLGPQKCAAITVTLWNPFVVERLLQGQWSLVMVAWLIPAVIAVGWVVLVWLCSLTPTGGLVAVVVALACRRWTLAGWGFVCLLPWVVPSMLTVPTSNTNAFLGRAEAYVGTLGAFVGLGGMWNAEVQPASRGMGFAIVGVVLFGLLVWWMPRRWLVLGGLAIGCFCLLQWGPTLPIPGMALFRDSQKLAIFLIPGLVTAAARVPNRLGVVVVLLALVQIPDAPVVLTALKPVPAPTVIQARGDVLNVDSQGLVVYRGRTVIDPMYKMVNSVEAGTLVVDGEVVDPPSPRYVAGVRAWQEGDMHTLEELRVSHVISQGEVVDLRNNAVHKPPYTGLGLLVLWLCVPIASIAAAKRRPVSSQE